MKKWYNWNGFILAAIYLAFISSSFVGIVWLAHNDGAIPAFALFLATLILWLKFMITLIVNRG